MTGVRKILATAAAAAALVMGAAVPMLADAETVTPQDTAPADSWPKSPSA
ncbi:hypothetical protein [Streptomyces sp. B6B3]